MPVPRSFFNASFLQRLTWVVSWLLGTRQKASLNILMVGKSFILMENFSLRNFCRLWIRTVEMLPTFFSYTAISYMLFCFSPFLCLSLVSVRCCALCFCWLIFFFFHTFLPPSLSHQFLDYATETQYFSIVFTQKWPYPFLDRGNRSHELHDTVWLKPWIYIWASFLPSGLVSCCLLGSCISLQLLCCSICCTILLYIHLVTL